MSNRLPDPPYKIEDHGFITPCWIWLGTSRKGYGQAHNPQHKHGLGPKMISAHVMIYEKIKGPVSERSRTFVPDHLCKIKLCVNPDHIEWITVQKNIIRGKESILKEQKKYNIMHTDTKRHYCDKCSCFYLTSESLIVHKERDHNYRPDFTIPPPYRAYCNRCNKGFMTLDDLTRHDREFHDYRRF